MTPSRINTYRKFWPYYLREHSLPGTRRIHLFGTILATLALAAGLTTGRLSLIILSLFAGYGPAWFGHFFIEKNRPATFTYPLWPLASDYRMAFTWLFGRVHDELVKAGIPQR
jgi:hypothetical protein